MRLDEILRDWKAGGVLPARIPAEVVDEYPAGGQWGFAAPLRPAMVFEVNGARYLRVSDDDGEFFYLEAEALRLVARCMTSGG